MANFVETTDGNLVNLDFILRMIPDGKGDEWTLYDARDTILGEVSNIVLLCARERWDAGRKATVKA